VRRTLQRIDGDALDAAVGTWLAWRESTTAGDGTHGDRLRPSIAVDGKTVRGARRPDGTQGHLLAAMTGTGLVTAQRDVDGKTNEITAFHPLLAGLDLDDTVVTFDALRSQTGHARFLVEDCHAHYIALIKGNHPTLHRWLRALSWREAPLGDKTQATAHGRDEIRRLKTTTPTRIAFPYAAQPVQIVRRRRTVTTGKYTLERLYSVTDLTAEQADATEIARYIRDHWGIENKLHHLRDTTYAEDTTRSGSEPYLQAAVNQVVDRSGGYPHRVYLHDDREQGTVDATSAFQEAGEEAAGADLGDGQVQVVGLCGEGLAAVSVAEGGTGVGALAPAAPMCAVASASISSCSSSSAALRIAYPRG
jgi:predicted transposase YbfD/YdcC